MLDTVLADGTAPTPPPPPGEPVRSPDSESDFVILTVPAEHPTHVPQPGNVKPTIRVTSAGTVCVDVSDFGQDLSQSQVSILNFLSSFKLFQV